jgi:hypothetical protein
MWGFERSELHVTTVGQSFSSHSKTVSFLRHEGLRPSEMGFTRAIALRFRSRSMLAHIRHGIVDFDVFEAPSRSK